MMQMQHDTEKLRTEGTGQWFFQDQRFIEWENNAGILWVEGPCKSFNVSYSLLGLI